MNNLYPEPLQFHPNSSPEDTREACREYGIRMPSLNADLFEELLSKTSVNEKLQRSLVRGWREGLDLGAELPPEDHLVKEPKLDRNQLKVLKDSLAKEVEKKRLKGPLAEPVRDGRWFFKAWVSPYFVIPKKLIPEEPPK